MNERTHTSAVVPTEPWIYRLKQAYDAGYYRTEPDHECQTAFPWQDKTCKDCPFWAGNVCQVFSEHRNGVAHTCSYFDDGNRPQAELLLQERQQVVRRWWERLTEKGRAA